MARIAKAIEVGAVLRDHRGDRGAHSVARLGHGGCPIGAEAVFGDLGIKLVAVKLRGRSIGVEPQIEL